MTIADSNNLSEFHLGWLIYQSTSSLSQKYHYLSFPYNHSLRSSYAQVKNMSYILYVVGIPQVATIYIKFL